MAKTMPQWMLDLNAYLVDNFSDNWFKPVADGGKTDEEVRDFESEEVTEFYLVKTYMTENTVLDTLGFDRGALIIEELYAYSGTENPGAQFLRRALPLMTAANPGLDIGTELGQTRLGQIHSASAEMTEADGIALQELAQVKQTRLTANSLQRPSRTQLSGMRAVLNGG